ncbi:MAG TPA: MarR family winged helix-turn-helix transcriptional regulator [Thermomicrobiales bacterium]|nr:MarR family winged helix-turn-helix transcriptional regulator [Thermomicrobiales bacterium]
MNDTTGQATEICSSIIWLGHLIERFANTRLPEAELPPGMSIARANLLFAVHTALEHEGSTRMVDISLDLGVTPRTLTTMVDALEKQGFLTRVPDPEDRRAIQLELTEEGSSLVPVLAQAVESASEVIVSPLGPVERETLMRLLTRLIERE